ncbi:MAG TPA: sugar nucleotide-binding protein [Candidatus Bathyarchaeia archaeon]|nr:sugar nucleotide-binding protein [Candidatus Bathyarchaeia archaeon]
MKKVIIFGASGTIGGTLAKELSEQGYEVYGSYLTRRPIHLPEERTKQLSLEQLEALRSFLQKVQPDYAVMSLHGDYADQMVFHEHVADYLETKGGRMIFCSTTNVYDACFDAPVTEQDPPSAATDYGQYKLACEQAMRATLGDALTIVRIPAIYGIGSPRTKGLLEKIKNREPIVIYSNLLRTINTDTMLAKQIRWLMDKDRSGAFHLATEDILSDSVFTKRLIERWGYPDVAFQEEELSVPSPPPDNQLYFALRSQVAWPSEYVITHDQVIEELGCAPLHM